MTKRECFIEMVTIMLKDAGIEKGCGDELYEQALEFWDEFCSGQSNNSAVTESGLKILKHLATVEVPMDAKSIGLAIGVNSKSVSGSMRKLVSSAFVTKESQNPVMYLITDAGRAIVEN